MLGVVGQMIMSPMLDIVALGFAPQTVLAPFNGLSLVWNTVLAPFVLKESLSRSRVAGCVVITAGMLINGAASSHESNAERVPGGAPEDVDDEEPPPAGTAAAPVEITWDADYISGVLFRDVVLLYFFCLAAWVAGNLVFLRSRPPGERLRGLSIGAIVDAFLFHFFNVWREMYAYIFHSLVGFWSYCCG